MIFKDYYWYFTSVIPPKLCDDIIHYALSKKEMFARTGGYQKEKLTKKDIKDIKKYRNSDLVWLNEPWIYKELHPYVHAANKNAGWNFNWNHSEACQFTKYKVGQYYDWHCDSWEEPYNKPNTIEHGKIRKLSMTCQLTDGSEYEGGELEFDFRNYNPSQRDELHHLVKAKQILPKGSIIVFPSYVYHRVKPVTKGVRYSLVMWNLGYPFK
jgi:PKHD-type hydroxylase